jgi:hypothetical protein
MPRARRPEDLSGFERSVRDASLSLTGARLPVIDVADAVACGVTPATFARARDLAEYALTHGTAIVSTVSQAHPAVVARRLVHPVVLCAPWMASLDSGRAGSWADRAMRWIALMATTPDRALLEEIRSSLIDNGAGFCDLWDGLLDDRSVLAVAAGLTLEEAVAAETSEGLCERSLRALAALRGFPPLVPGWAPLAA